MNSIIKIRKKRLFRKICPINNSLDEKRKTRILSKLRSFMNRIEWNVNYLFANEIQTERERIFFLSSFYKTHSSIVGTINCRLDGIGRVTNCVIWKVFSFFFFISQPTVFDVVESKLIVIFSQFRFESLLFYTLRVLFIVCLELN